ncbi:hypothetical protein LEN26_012505 [Aphanomyces euteiches]|nr:hypothetical protein LEN26_012505 [Aphanomyces euteiches]KAH9185480.1 hypothetical protein AeNC1_012545 [Aphanomyces euteiches]
MESTTLRASKTIAQTELQQLKETLRRLSVADDIHSSVKMSSLVAPMTTTISTTTSRPDNQKGTSDATTTSSSSPCLANSFATIAPSGFVPSSNNNLSSTTGASNSKAVLSALKALQDKLRRVEEEKAEVDAQCANLKAQLRSNEAQQLSASKKASYELQQVKEAAHAAYEALKAERDALAADLSQSKHETAIKANELDHANDMMASYKEKAEYANEQTKHVEAQLVKVQAELTESTLESKERILELQEALHSATRSGKEAARKIQSLEDQLQRANDANASLEGRLHDAEKTVGQMSQLNEKLVHNLWASKAKPKKAAKKQPTAASSTAPQKSTVVTRSTAASRANAVPTTTSLAAKRQTTKVVSTTKKKKKSSSSANNKTQLEVANMGHVPFLLGTSTSPSFSVIGSAQEVLRHSDAYAAVAPDVKPSLLIDTQTDFHDAVDGGDKPTKASFMHNISKAVKSVEAEFQQLNNRYKALVAHVEGNPGVGKSIEKTIDELEAKGEQLFLLKQLQSQASKSSIFAARHVLHSPDAAEKKVAALRVLHEYRKLDREMKARSPRASSTL